MARGPNSGDEARRIAEAAMPGWRALAPDEEQPVNDAPASEQAEAHGVDMGTLKERYLSRHPAAAPAEPASGANPNPAGDDDAQFVTMTPRRDQDAPSLTRKVIVSRGRVVAVQG
jgi:hypothetical protein